MARLSQKQIEEKFLENGLTPYLKGNEKATNKIVCEDSEGYLCITTYEYLRDNRKPLRFGKRNPFTIKNIKRWLILNANNIELIDEVFMGNHEPLKCRCKIDGYEWSPSWASLQGYHGCPKCAGKLRLTIEEVKERVKSINPNIEIIDDTYTNCHTKMKCKCKIDNHEWEICWANIISGCGCPKCAIRNLTGSNNPSWNGGTSRINKFFRSCCFMDSWKKKSMEICDYKCVISGSKNFKIHHLYSFSEILKETMKELELKQFKDKSYYTDEELYLMSEKFKEIHNKYGLGVCLDVELHEEFHSIYTRYNNTPEQFLEFYKNKTGKDFDINILQYTDKVGDKCVSPSF